ELLASCYTSSLAIAANEGLDTVAFPAISTGVYGYPREKAAPVAFKAIRDFLSTHPTPSTVYLVFFSDADADVFLASI
ncbi:MAG TPA: macro domain-containing protein, partial [Spirochaetales bacterium]|nr:macro domain-containing protein [Spirochaetales bacterium]